ncbi:hypothetical protein [Methylovirgula sp. 4M-Z18]|uniref:hypothetical protein n=1 Tax=Methylovirgula sp. 4M-Z18 TaxID=2293567 RepID=UPI000E2E86CF|nr:hypothetical protein [Methylovirgula sp. 4M-Z18]RFB78091.1 hypothetical protein DYH55_19000 [Methylovirgula sp. 4M-Z18]
MRFATTLSALVLCTGAALLTASAEAATIKHKTVGCRKDADLKKPAAFESMITNGECFQLLDDSTVSVDQRHGPYVCVRPSGVIDCLWVAANVIDEAGGTSESDSHASMGQAFFMKPFTLKPKQEQ